MSSDRKMPEFILFFFIADLALVLVYAMDWGIGGLSWKLTALLDLKGQISLSTWYSSMQLFLIAFFLALFARYKLDRRVRSSWVLPVLPLVFAGLSFEEIDQIHELARYHVLHLLPAVLVRTTPFYCTRVWTLMVGVPFIIIILVVGYYARQYTKGRIDIALKFLFGVMLFVGAATVMETCSNFIPRHTAFYVFQTVCEELGRMAGVTIMLWATYELLAFHGVPFTGSPIPMPASRDDPPA